MTLVGAGDSRGMEGSDLTTRKIAILDALRKAGCLRDEWAF